MLYKEAVFNIMSMQNVGLSYTQASNNSNYYFYFTSESCLPQHLRKNVIYEIWGSCINAVALKFVAFISLRANLSFVAYIYSRRMTFDLVKHIAKKSISVVFVKVSDDPTYRWSVTERQSKQARNMKATYHEEIYVVWRACAIGRQNI